MQKANIEIAKMTAKKRRLDAPLESTRDMSDIFGTIALANLTIFRNWMHTQKERKS